MGIRSDSSTSITIDFRYKGIRCRERIKLKPSKANLAYAARLEMRIIEAIEKNEFDYAHFFPESKRAKLFASSTRAITVL